MNALSIRSDVAGMAMRHARGLENVSRRQAKKVSFVETLLSGVIGNIFSPFSQVLATCACQFVDKKTALIADKAVWFQGAAAAVEDGALMPASAEATLSLIKEITKLQADFIELRKSVLSLMSQFESNNPQSRISNCLRRQVVVLADLYDAVERFRWAVMEYEADSAMAQGKVAMFDNVEDLFGSLDS